MLTAADLSAIRSTAQASLTDVCLITRATPTSDSAGGYTSGTYNLQATTVCRVAPARSPAEINLAERVAAVQGWTLTLPYDSDVRPTDRLRVGATVTTTSSGGIPPVIVTTITGGRTFEVIGRLAAETYETARRVVCVEIL